MDVSALVEWAKSKPYLAGGVALASAGAVAWVWATGRGKRSGPAPVSGNGFVGDTTGTPVAVVNPAQPAPVQQPAPLPTPKPQGDMSAPMPKGYECPSGGRPVYERKPGSFVQTTGAVVCMFADRRLAPLQKIGAKPRPGGTRKPTSDKSDSGSRWTLR